MKRTLFILATTATLNASAAGADGTTEPVIDPDVIAGEAVSSSTANTDAIVGTLAVIILLTIAAGKF